MILSSRTSKDTLSHDDSMELLQALVELELLVSSMSEQDFIDHRDSLILGVREVVDYVSERT
jgi:hypothetical protein